MPRDDGPLLEHPTGEFATAKEAITEAIRRVRAHGQCGRWAVLSGQGRGARVDAYRIAEVRFREDTIDFGEPVPNLLAIASACGSEVARMRPGPDARTVCLPGASPRDIAQLLDAVLREHFKIRPFEGEHDYAFGAEWSAPVSSAPVDKARIAPVIDLATRRR